jgi:hypothetical protein
MPHTYTEGQKVLGHKLMRSGLRRWCKATILYLVSTAEGPSGEAYMVEFADGSRGMFDLDHIRGE